MKQLEYIESTGTQYIDTGVNTSNQLGFEIKFNQTAIVGSYDTIIGGQKSQVGLFVMNSYSRNSNSKNVKYNSAQKSITTSSAYYQADVIVSLSGNTFVYDNGVDTPISITAGSTGTFSQTAPFYIFGMYDNTRPGCLTSAKVYYCKIYEGATLVRDFIPVKDSNDVACLYDKVSETFFYNAGTGNFIAGPEIVTQKDLLLNLDAILAEKTNNIVPRKH